MELPENEAAEGGSVVRACAGKIDPVVELLTGKLSGAVMEVLCREETGLFPSTKEISLACSCPDGAWLCKHLAAVLYGVGARLDHEPELLFVLRGVDQMDLVAAASTGGALRKTAKTANTLDGGNLSDIFGIEMDDGGRPATSIAKRAAPARTKVARGRQKVRRRAVLTK